MKVSGPIYLAVASVALCASMAVAQGAIGSEATVSARGLIQGGVLRHGAGRLAVFGEAAMFTAQTSVSNGVVSQMGLNHPSASANAQFVLNLFHWLVGLVDD